jgi:hypothetical protein
MSDCFYCGGEGHWRDKCPKLAAKKAKIEAK